MKQQLIDILYGYSLGITSMIILLLAVTDVLGTTIDTPITLNITNNIATVTNHKNATLSLSCSTNQTAILPTNTEYNNTIINITATNTDYAQINNSIEYYFKQNTDTFNTSKCIINRESLISAYRNETNTLIAQGNMAQQEYFANTVIKQDSAFTNLTTKLQDCELTQKNVEMQSSNYYQQNNYTNTLKSICEERSSDYKIAFYGLVILFMITLITIFGGNYMTSKKMGEN